MPVAYAALLGALCVMLAGLAGCGGGDGAARSSAAGPPADGASPSATSAAASPVPTAPASTAAPTVPAGVPAPTAALKAYLGNVRGTLGVQVRDRVTGTSWQLGDVGFATWTASTIKLAVATALLERNRAGSVTLTSADRANMRAMLVNSSNEATDALWTKFDGVGTLPLFQQRYGMANLSVVPGYRPYWRHLRCSTSDLAAVMTYALGTLPAADRAELVGMLRAAVPVQPWGVWGAGSAAQPGHKPGWAFKPEGTPDHWVVHSVGFAGPGERYVVAVMYDLPKGGGAGSGVRDGAQVVTDVVALAFGRPVTRVNGP